MSLQVDIKKKIIKGKKPSYKLMHFSQNNKKPIKLSDHNNNNNIITNTKSENLNNSKTIQKLQEELNMYKTKSQKLEEEIIRLNFKIKEITEKNETMCLKKEEEKNSEEDNSSNSFSTKHKTNNSLKKAISSAYETLIELIELILNQKNYKAQDKETKAENISMDIYESSVYNDEERKSLLFEQIQQILIFKINFINKKYNLNLEKQCERIKNWNLNNINITKDNNKDISFSSFSALSNNKKRSLNVSINNSDIGSGIGISPPRSPKFQGQVRRDSISAISNLMDESTIKDLSTSIINYNNANHNVLGGDSFFFENENLSKSKEDIDTKEQSKTKEINLINTSFKDLSLIRSGDEQVGNISFNKDTNNIEGEEKDDSNNDVIQNKEIFIKDENKLNISFNDI